MRKMKAIWKLVGASTLAVATQFALAAPVPSNTMLSNGGFEGGLTSWSTGGTSVSEGSSAGSSFVYDGTNSAVFGAPDSSVDTLSQGNISLISGGLYRLSFYLSQAIAGGGDDLLMTVSMTGTSNPLSLTVDFADNTDDWFFYTADFTATGSGLFALTFTATGADGNLMTDVGLDNVGLVCRTDVTSTSNVCLRDPNPGELPEPGSLALVGVALAGGAWFGRRRKLI